MNYLLKILLSIILNIFRYIGISILVILVIFTLYALPAIFSLPHGIRPGLEPMTIEEAVAGLRDTGRTDAELIEEARSMVGERMVYCRRNSYNSYEKAFKRGYGFCQQQAFALARLLKDLGYDAVPVQAIRTQFPDGNIGGHAWVMIYLNGEALYIDPVYYDPAKQEVTFIPLSQVTGYSTFFRILAGWGCASINAHRFYVSGSD